MSIDRDWEPHGHGRAAAGAGAAASGRLPPKNITAKLNAAVTDALVASTVRARLAELGQEGFPTDRQTPEALAASQKAEIEKSWPVIKAANIKGE